MRTSLRTIGTALLGLTLALAAGLGEPRRAAAQDKVGVILMHGKQGAPGYVRTGLPAIASSLQSEGNLAMTPAMPWSVGNWESIKLTVDQVFDLIDGYAARLRSQGAARIVVAGQSLGANMALSYAVERGNVAGVVMIAPGHNPAFQYRSNESIRSSVDRTVDLVKSGQGNVAFSGLDVNQANTFPISTTAQVYLSWMDPRGKAAMDVQAPKLPASIPVLLVIGNKDPAFPHAKSAWYNPAATNPYSRYVEVMADHVTTPAAAATQIVDWIDKLPK